MNDATNGYGVEPGLGNGYSYTSGFGGLKPGDSSFQNNQYDRAEEIDLNELQNYI